MSFEWFRWYHGTTSDSKFAVVSRKAKQPKSIVIAVWAAVLEYASHHQDRGSIDGIDHETIAACLDVDDDAVSAILAVMIAKGLISGDRVAAWEKRQVIRERDDDSKERVRRYREKTRTCEVVTPSNATVTPSNAIGNAPDADADADVDADVDKDSSVLKKGVVVQRGVEARARNRANATAPTNFPTCPDWLPAETWNGFIAHRKAKRKSLTPIAATLVLRDLDKARCFGHDPVALIETAIASGWTGCVFEDKHFQPAPSAPTGGQDARSGDPRIAEVQDILASMKRSVIEGEFSHVAH